MLLLVMWLLLLLNSCIATYVPPKSGETATVRFTTPHVIINNPVMIHTDTCSELDAFRVGRLHSQTWGETYSETLQTTVVANQKLSVSMVAGEDKNAWIFLTCRRIVDFYPQAGGFYEVAYIFSQGKCFYNVSKIEKDAVGNETKTPEPTAKVRLDCRL